MAFLIADNRLTENSSWDERMLGEQLKVLSELELDFDLDAIGFEVPEIDLLIDGLTTVPEADPDDHLPQMSENAVTVSGDLWQLGKHRVLCGNSLIGKICAYVARAPVDLVPLIEWPNINALYLIDPSLKQSFYKMTSNESASTADHDSLVGDGEAWGPSLSPFMLQGLFAQTCNRGLMETRVWKRNC
jgi:hypothetical protein